MKCIDCAFAMADGLCLGKGGYTLLDADACESFRPRAGAQAKMLKAENAKLRELIKDMWPFVKAGSAHTCPNRECSLFEECDADSERECPIEEHMAARMRELGIEVN